MQTDHGTHIVKRLRRNQKLPPGDLVSLFMFARPRRKSPGHRTISGTGQTRRVIWREFWIENEARIYRMFIKNIPHHQIADSLGITRRPLQAHLNRMRQQDPVKYSKRSFHDHKEIIDQMIAEGARHKDIAKRIEYSVRTISRYLQERRGKT